MSNKSTNKTVAFGDESIRMTAETPMYLLAASVLGEDWQNAVNHLESLKPKTASKLHWRDMGTASQRDSLLTIASLSHATSIVVASPLVGNKQERARRKCLQTLLSHLEEEGVELLTLESRGAFLDKKDIDFLLYLRRSGFVSSIDLTHVAGGNEPRLCVPDQILGAYGNVAVEGIERVKWAEKWRDIDPSITTIEIRL